MIASFYHTLPAWRLIRMASWLAGGFLGKIAYVLVLVGGIVLVVSGIADLIGMTFFVPSALGSVFGGAIFQMILGGAAFVLARRVKELLWTIVILLIGLIGGSIGGAFVAVGAIVSLVLIFLKRV